MRGMWGFDPIETHTVSPSDQKGVEAGVAPGPTLNVGRGRIGRAGPPLRQARALGQHIADLAFHLDEGEFELIRLLSAEIVSKRIVFAHRFR